jgi:Asp-tRNA(Asn)/Glu-tRNA(Gln) amidotransferase A subunit family amidase
MELRSHMIPDEDRTRCWRTDSPRHPTAMGASTEYPAYGPTYNPWDLGRIPGGSGGGSAAAVAAHEAPIAVGTDAAASPRPA